MPVATFYHIPIGIKVIKKEENCQFAAELRAVLQRKDSLKRTDPSERFSRNGSFRRPE
jgi:hypothetical protein